MLIRSDCSVVMFKSFACNELRANDYAVMVKSTRREEWRKVGVFLQRPIALVQCATSASTPTGR